MKYKVTFSVTDTYPTVEIDAKDRDEAIKLYHDLWKQGKLSQEGIAVAKDARWNVQSIWNIHPKAAPFSQTGQTR
jgi:hypothetical protein